MRAPLVLAFVPLLGLVAGCSSESEGCRRPLEQSMGECPASFDGTEAALPRCSGLSGYEVQRVQRCAARLILRVSHGYSGFSCYYDVTSHVLVGKSWGNDLGQSCSSGEIGGVCDPALTILERDCSRLEQPDGSIEVR